MDSQNYIINSMDRKRGQHLRREDRGAIQALKRLGYSNRAIARTIGCSPSTVSDSLDAVTSFPKRSILAILLPYIVLGLLGKHFAVLPIQLHQLFVTSDFTDRSTIKHNDPVCITDRGQPVRNDDSRGFVCST